MSQCIHQLKWFGLSLLLLGISGLWVSCANADRKSDWKPGDTITLNVAGHALEIELALTRAMQARGLMKRESLPENHGMLFVFDRPERRSFWMKDTWIPLDIAYIDASGTIREIHALFPNNQNSVVSKSREIQFALETNRGWFKGKGIRPGDRIELDSLLPILREHGIRTATDG